MASLSSAEKDLLQLLEIYYNIVFLHVNLEIKFTQTLRKETSTSSQWPCCSKVTVLLYNICPFICDQISWKPCSKYFILSTSLFQGKFIFLWRIYWVPISITVTLHHILRTNIFQNSYCWLVIEKWTKSINKNKKSENRLWELEITHWGFVDYVFTGNYFA